MEINDYLINEDSTIYDALLKIEKNKHRSLIVVNNDYKVVGSISDGDIRKGLINSILLNAPVHKLMNLNCKVLGEYSSEEEVLNMFNDYNIFIIPIVDEKLKIIQVRIK
jgi:CBS domain-containing protein